MQAERERRQGIIHKLQEHIKLTWAEMKLQKERKQTVIKEYDQLVQEHNTDVEFQLILLHEFSAREEDAYHFDEEEEVVEVFT